ncbi:MAG: AAA family ATPase [Magnetococcales bacterium]|nr:AAA family ATPase [Magnetococcales bacterium]MBF0323254.1 AAA family ATPase [Magnetococcales bacterium]
MLNEFTIKHFKSHADSTLKLAPLTMLIGANASGRGGNKPSLKFSDQSPVFNQFNSPWHFRQQNPKSRDIILKANTAIRSCLSNILFLDLVVGKMRGYSHIKEKNLIGDGRNISSVLYHLWGEDKEGGDGLTKIEKENRENILKFISSLPEQKIETISFIKTAREDVMLELSETFGGACKKFDVSELSDGTLRVLAMAAALLSVPDGSMVVMDEFDNGIHPSRAKAILEHIDFFVGTSSFVRISDQP